MFFLISLLTTAEVLAALHPTTGAIALQHANLGEEGEISANLQFTDAFSPGLSIGFGGAFIAISESLQWGLLPTNIFEVFQFTVLSSGY